MNNCAKIHMKRLFLTLIIAFSTAFGFAQDVESSKVDYYEIKGKLKNVPDGIVLQLFAFEGERGFFVGTTKGTSYSTHIAPSYSLDVFPFKA